jgi:hypothetical protein
VVPLFWTAEYVTNAAGEGSESGLGPVYGVPMIVRKLKDLDSLKGCRSARETQGVAINAAQARIKGMR